MTCLLVLESILSGFQSSSFLAFGSKELLVTVVSCVLLITSLGDVAVLVPARVLPLALLYLVDISVV